MKKITKLTSDQEARFPEFIRKWIDIGLSTQPADRPRAEKAIVGLYRLAKLEKPMVIWLPCPISAALSAACYEKTIQHRIVDRPDGASVYSAVRSAVRSAVGGAVSSAVGGAVRSAVGGAVRSAVRSAVYSAVDSAVYSAVDSAVYSAVGSAVDSAVYSAVDSSVGSAVDSAVRSAVDSAVYSAVGSAVDSAVYSAVDSSVGSAVDSSVGSAVRSAGRSFFGGSLYNSGYCSWADYFSEICAIAIDRNFLEITESCGLYWTLDGICFASERPSAINLDNEGRLHSETGMSIRYAGTGWGMYHWHGTQIPAEWIINRTKLTPAIALMQKNIEQRRAACEILGWVNILRALDAKTLDKDRDPQIGELVEVKLPDIGGMAKFLRVQCGTGREFAIGIPPHINKAIDAQAWIVGLDPKDFFLPEIRA